MKKDFSKLSKNHRKLIDDYIKNKLINDPYKNSKKLKGALKGIRSHKMEKLHNFRLIFVICEECRKIGYDKKLRCPDCGEIDDKTVKLILYDYRDKIYDKLERMLK